MAPTEQEAGLAEAAKKLRVAHAAAKRAYKKTQNAARMKADEKAPSSPSRPLSKVNIT